MVIGFSEYIEESDDRCDSDGSLSIRRLLALRLRRRRFGGVELRESVDGLRSSLEPLEERLFPTTHRALAVSLYISASRTHAVRQYSPLFSASNSVQ